MFYCKDIVFYAEGVVFCRPNWPEIRKKVQSEIHYNKSY